MADREENSFGKAGFAAIALTDTAEEGDKGWEKIHRHPMQNGAQDVLEAVLRTHPGMVVDCVGKIIDKERWEARHSFMINGIDTNPVSLTEEVLREMSCWQVSSFNKTLSARKQELLNGFNNFRDMKQKLACLSASDRAEVDRRRVEKVSDALGRLTTLGETLAITGLNEVSDPKETHEAADLNTSIDYNNKMGDTGYAHITEEQSDISGGFEEGLNTDGEEDSEFDSE